MIPIYRVSYNYFIMYIQTQAETETQSQSLSHLSTCLTFLSSTLLIEFAFITILLFNYGVH